MRHAHKLDERDSLAESRRGRPKTCPSILVVGVAFAAALAACFSLIVAVVDVNRTRSHMDIGTLGTVIELT